MEKVKSDGALYMPVQIGLLKISVFVDKDMYVVDGERISTPHCHYLYELRHVETGGCALNVNGELIKVARHSSILVRPKEYHYQSDMAENDRGSQHTLRFAIKKPTADDKSAAKRAYAEIVSLLSSVRVVKDDRRMLAGLLRRVYEELLSDGAGRVSCLCSLVTLILTDFFRACSGSLHNVFPSDEVKYSGSSVRHLERFFADNYKNDIKISDLAAELCLSERQTSRIINLKYGVSFSKKLTEVRLARAEYMLISSDETVENIGIECGFKNSASFFKSFKDKHGITPLGYRNIKNK